MELPINTIVIVAMAAFVLIVVGIFFFSEANASNHSFDSAQCVQLCFTALSRIATGDSADNAKTDFCGNNCKNDCFITKTEKISC